MRVVKLVEISELKTGPFGTQFSANEYVIDGIPVINVKNIGYGNIIETGMGYVGQSTRWKDCLIIDCRRAILYLGEKGQWIDIA